MKIVPSSREAGDEGDASSLEIAEEPVRPGVAAIEWLASVLPTAVRAAEAEVVRRRHARSITAESPRWSWESGRQQRDDRRKRARVRRRFQLALARAKQPPDYRRIARPRKAVRHDLPR